MNLIRFNPERSVPRFVDFFNTFSDRNYDELFNSSVPAVNIKEGKDDFKIEVVAPGLNKEDFRLELNKNLLSISSERKEEAEDKDEQYSRREYRYCSFSRSFRLPDGVNAEKIAAKYEDGILKIGIPKAEEAKDKGPKAIPIR
ncbi:MAG: Hsp20/alpha crystallin family protein [Bacteroidetes bacterium]|nr:Hsp20/alpha crystallin family protein [Bacteroidota bacterium]